MLKFLRQHWRGELTLAVSFWVNLVLVFAAVQFLERYSQPPYVDDSMATAAALAFFLVARLLVYPWQAVGVIRACERHIVMHGGRGWAVAAQGVVVISLAATLVATFASYQAVLRHRLEARAAEAVPDAALYTLTLVADFPGSGAGAGADLLIHLRGELQVGVTSQVAALLAAHAQISGIILDSGGGHIYAGRGLARLIRERALNTYVGEQCASSCATAFIAGAVRTLGAGARLGFHQYTNLGKQNPALPAMDIDAEHAKDMAWFESQGISADFLAKIFAQPPHKMWWPPAEELRRAGVIHHRVPAL